MGLSHLGSHSCVITFGNSITNATFCENLRWLWAGQTRKMSSHWHLWAESRESHAIIESDRPRICPQVIV